MDDQIHYYHTMRRLELIAYSYKDLIGGDLLSAKIDFDLALNSLGHGKWDGMEWDDGEPRTRLEDYRGFGNLQIVIIADVLGYKNEDLEAYGIKNPPNWRRRAYRRMRDFLLQEGD